MPETKLKWGCQTNTTKYEGSWALGATLYKEQDECFLFINLFYLNISIGKFLHII